ncbi:Acg family FMN-binding oxidoreductase [Streptomyces sp. NPDC001599]|uniref:Acg family FMN-binding oxidoreductase n=1 Tax=Streptomyces sp. NPDC001599 TaxID=3364591 RepID=UPI00367B84A7
MGTEPLDPAAAATAYAAPPPRGAAFDAWRDWENRDGAHGLVAAGILAANARNVQPWRFTVDDGAGRVDLYADLTRRQGALDPFDRELHVGLGCALENMVLAARARGLAPELTLLPDPGRPEHAATLRLTPGERVPSELYDAIPHRRTNRGPFRREPLPRALLDEIGALAADDPGAPALLWFADEERRARVAHLLVEATEAVVADEGQSLAGHRWYRGTDGAVERHRDGMTVDTQGMSRTMSSLGKRLPAPSRRTADRFWLRNTRSVHVATAAAFGMVTVADTDDPALRMRGGRLLQRVHLFATARGLAVGHLNMMTVRADRERELGLPPRFGKALDELVGDAGGRTLVTFRIGRPARLAGTSPRRPVATVLGADAG